ncbi:unnamed protein product [Acidithrix sp. C25]|nr:unnamed protein product [Acidithrix sp. C25]
MAELGISGVRRGKTYVVTTVANELVERPKDLVNRNFTSNEPNNLWVADITYVKTKIGWAYVAFVTDVFSRTILGWKVSPSLKANLATDALEMAIHQRAVSPGLVHHSDRGVQYLSVRYSQRLIDVGITASVGSKGDSYDNALAETTNGIYKAELVNPHGPFFDVDELEWATLGYIDWFNNRRLHGSIGMIPPVEFEDNHHSSSCDNKVA